MIESVLDTAACTAASNPLIGDEWLLAALAAHESFGVKVQLFDLLSAFRT